MHLLRGRMTTAAMTTMMAVGDDDDDDGIEVDSEKEAKERAEKLALSEKLLSETKISNALEVSPGDSSIHIKSVAPSTGGRINDKREWAKYSRAPLANEVRIVEDGCREKKSGAYYARDELRRRANRQLYRKLDTTREYVENNYYHLPIKKMVHKLITVNGFWKDFAAADPGAPFFSLPSSLAPRAISRR